MWRFIDFAGTLKSLFFHSKIFYRSTSLSPTYPPPPPLPSIVPFLSLFAFCCLVFDLSAGSTLAVLAYAAAATFFALAPFLLVLADTAAATLFTLAPLPLMLRRCCCCHIVYSRSSAAGARRCRCRHVLYIFSSVSQPGARRCRCPHSPYICLAVTGAQVLGLAGLLGYSRRQLRSRGLASGVGCTGSTLLVLAVLIVWPLNGRIEWPTSRASSTGGLNCRRHALRAWIYLIDYAAHLELGRIEHSRKMAERKD